MKKWLFILATVFCLVFFSFHAFAAEPDEVLVDRQTTVHSDGSYTVVSVYQDLRQARSDQISGHKDYSYYDGGLAWTFTVYGSFSYTGAKATCDAASYGVSIHNNDWYRVAGNAWPSGNAAVASGTMRRGSDGNNVYPSVTLYCSANGTLS